MDHTLETRARAWLAEDPDPVTRAELEQLLAVGNHAELADRFSGALEFGTAGMRGVLGAGPNRMNRVVVQRTTAGLCAYLARVVPGAAARGIAIGFDGRRMSAEFARDAAEVAAGAGFKVHVFDHVVPTPVLAYATLTLKAAAGVMVTASHNPPQYNGYKVYWENGAQIIPPHDVGIATEIAAVGALASIPREAWDAARASGRLQVQEPSLENAYLDGVVKLQRHPGLPRDIVIAYTALHGVGDRPCREALRRAGFTSVHSVAQQAEPDGAFPTVAFPNPEEKGAMDLALALARDVRADLVLANDPDADRLAVALPDGRGGHAMLSGNDVGCLLAHYLLETTPAGSRRRLVVNSIVSSPMLGAVAAAHGASWEATLTGFKWITNRAMEMERETGCEFIMGYEEALGYTVGTLVRDKDGIGAAVVMADLAAWCRAQGRTVAQELERAWRRYGLFVGRQVAVTLPGAGGAARMAAIMNAVRASPPTRLGDHAVTAVLDLERGERRVGTRVEKVALPPSNVLALEMEGGHRVMLRPSGTEPKIKYYFDVCERVRDDESMDAARARAATTTDRLVEAFLAVVNAVPG